MALEPSTIPSPLPWKYDRWGRVAFWAYFTLLVIIYGTAINTADSDLWHRFALFEHLVHTGHFPTGDTFNYNADYQFMPDHEWGGAVVFYPAYVWGGDAWLIIEKLVLLGATLLFTIKAGLGRRSPTMLETFFFSLVLLSILPSFLSTLRCGVFTHFFLALWVYWFQRERQGSPLFYAGYFATMVLWANLHGAFVIGLMWLGIVALWEFATGGAWKKRLGLVLLCVLATFTNPFGVLLWEGPLRALQISHSAFDEWGPVPWITPHNTYLPYKILCLWSVVILWGHVSRKGWKACDLFSVALIPVLLVISLFEARQTTLFAIIAGGLLPALFRPEISLHEIREPKPRLLRMLVRGTLVILPLILAARMLPSSQGFKLNYPANTYPAGAVGYLKDHRITGNLLVGFNAGSYALWKLQGQMRVSMDGRYLLVYRPETFEMIKSFFEGGDHWRDVIVNPAPDAILVERTDGVYGKLLAEPAWTQVYADDTHAVFLPSHAKTSP